MKLLREALSAFVYFAIGFFGVRQQSEEVSSERKDDQMTSIDLCQDDLRFFLAGEIGSQVLFCREKKK